MKVPHAYENYMAGLQPKGPRGALGRLAMSLILIEIAFALCRSFVDGLFGVILISGGGLAEQIRSGATALGLSLELILEFGLLLAVTLIIAAKRHQMGFRAIAGINDAFQDDLWRAFFYALVLRILYQLFLPSPSQWGAEMIGIATWVLWIPVAIMVLTLQCGTEEVLYRGFLQQKIAQELRRPWQWMLLTNLLFGLAHYTRADSVGAGIAYVVWAFCFGLACSDLTARTGSIAAAVGFHLANNLFYFAFAAEAGGHDSGYALWRYPPSVVAAAADGASAFSIWLLIDIMLVLVMWLAVRLGIRV